jgi:glutathione S-transferase
MNVKNFFHNICILNPLQVLEINMSVTLHYFDGYGKGEVVRMLLHAQGIAFTDNRFDGAGFEEFSKTGKAEFGQVPCLEIDGKTLVESRAIERYLLAKAGVQTTTPFEGYLNDSVISFLEDIRNIIAKFVWVDEDLEAFAKWVETDFYWYLRHLNGRVNEHNFFVGSTPQHADWAIFEFLWDGFLRPEKIEKVRALFEAHAPKLLRFTEHFRNHNQNLANYLSTRPDMPW